MGNAQAPPANPRFDSACRSFTRTELDGLKALFFSLAAQSQTDGQYISPFVFQAYFGIHGALGRRMFDLVTQKRNGQRLTYEDLIITKLLDSWHVLIDDSLKHVEEYLKAIRATSTKIGHTVVFSKLLEDLGSYSEEDNKGIYEKGTQDEIEEFIYQLLDVDGDGILGRSNLEAVLPLISDAVFSSKNAECGSISSLGIMEIFLSAAEFTKEIEGCSRNSMSFEDFKNWCSLLPSMRKFLGSLLTPPDPGKSGCQVPRLLHSEDINPDLLILRKEYAWHIGGALSQHDLEEWKLLYHSAVNGLSFSTFLSNILAGDGPTVLLIQDKEGYIYGGYASQPWGRHSDFYGDMKTFIFQLYPRASVFRPTGSNSNLQWCAVNFSSESIPNGIGFGGRVGHFGLFLSASFDQGHTFSCSTFGSPCLSKGNCIYPETIECWRVVESKQNERSNVVTGTVLERFKEDRNMLKMVGLANSSD